MTTNPPTERHERHDAIAVSDRDFILRFDISTPRECDPRITAAHNADAMQVLTPDLPRAENPRVAIVLAGKRDGQPDVLTSTAFVSPKFARELAALLLEAADAIEKGEEYARSTLCTWERTVTVSDHAQGSA